MKSFLTITLLCISIIAMAYLIAMYLINAQLQPYQYMYAIEFINGNKEILVGQQEIVYSKGLCFIGIYTIPLSSIQTITFIKRVIPEKTKGGSNEN